MDEGDLLALAGRVGVHAIEPLLEVLSESDSRHIRRKVIKVLVQMGPVVGERAVTRLQDARWYVVRNVLVLLRQLETTPEGFDAYEFATHDDRRVRREAFPIAVNQPALRDRTLATALADEDERMVYMALQQLRSGVPETLVPTVVKRRHPCRSKLGDAVVGRSHAGPVQVPACARRIGRTDHGRQDDFATPPYRSRWT